MNIYYVDGNFVPADQAVIPVDDLSVLRGYGVFDFLRTYNGKPFHLEEHLQRLENSARLINLSIPWSKDEISRKVMETLAKNSHEESNVRILITGGSSQDFITPDGKPRLIIMVTPLHRLPQQWYETGIKIITHPIDRHIPEAKSINYMQALIALKKAKSENAMEAIYLDPEGQMLEGTTSNLFAFFDSKLVTPDQEILQGITRNVVLEIAKTLFDIQMDKILKQRLSQVDEMFITASNKEIVPVVYVDDQVIGNGKPGPKTQKLMEKFHVYTQAFGKGV